ncbi:AAA family ATPase [Deinococcus cellulosilyticus]|nr:ATP-binding protein [Deinococcus cellulosilyticus]
MIERLRLKNFTAFEDLELTFSPGVNVLIGGNGTGKTHVLKAIYGLIRGPSRSGWGADGIPDSFIKIFLPLDNDLSRLQRTQGNSTLVEATISGYGKLDFRLPLPDGSAKLRFPNAAQKITGKNVLFMPAKDLIGHAKGLRSILKLYQTAFDQTYTDILDIAFLPSLQAENQLFQPILEKLKQYMGGGIPKVEEDQYFLNHKGKEIEFNLVAEGWRKIAVFWYILRNYPHLRSGDVILWDEPEANLNPSTLKGLAECLSDLSKLGLQIIVATHSYVLLKELEIHEARDLKFISLYTTDQQGVKASVATSYEGIEHNLIEKEFERIYRLDLGSWLERDNDGHQGR